MLSQDIIINNVERSDARDYVFRKTAEAFDFSTGSSAASLRELSHKVFQSSEGEIASVKKEQKNFYADEK